MLDQLDIFDCQLYRGLVLVPEPREASHDAKDLRGWAGAWDVGLVCIANASFHEGTNRRFRIDV